MDWSVKKIIEFSSGLFDFEPLYERVAGDRWKNWADQLREDIPNALEVSRNGHLPLWLDTFQNLPRIEPDEVHLDQAVIKVRSHTPIPESTTRQIDELLMRMIPWRKGPFRIHDVLIDTEWQCNQKWDRLKAAIAPLDNRRILDVGCGNGYYALRMLGDGARFVIGVDPYLRYIMQYRMLCHFLGSVTQPVQLAPVPFESMPVNLEMFDTVFSMGVLYHQRSPFDHLQRLFEALRSGGELVLESIVIDGNEHTVLVPQDRYAKMRNVWFIPSAQAIEIWMKKIGFKNVRTVHQSITSIREQRSTRWMPYESLVNFLDPNDLEKTFEGYPAPKRAIILAEKP
ncbi:MAG: tRNA 5-methoxyuridine(34)/uridine 5-oxyacetic acid(34) synthase CmoB [Puniceicoccaceae bacterium]